MDTDFSESMGPANACIMVLMGQVHAVERRFWAQETRTDWWDRTVLQVWDNSQWLRNFRMRKGTFMELCDLLSPALRRMNTKMRAALTVEKQVTIALWKLATPDSYQSVGNQFGVGKSTVGAAVMQVAHAIKDLPISRVVTLGNVQVIVDGFAAMGFPYWWGHRRNPYPYLGTGAPSRRVHKPQRVLFDSAASSGGSQGTFHQHQRGMAGKGA
ncbi:unnamed protein product [Caretta caretta]